MRLAAALIAASLLGGCDEMARQPRDDVYGRSPLFPNGAVMQWPPDGTVARGEALETVQARPEMSLGLIQRGRERYEIYCAVCHDPSGYGQGVVPARGFPKPPSFHSDRLRHVPSRHFVDVITNGHGVMYAYDDRVAPSDRWAIAAYIRALQLSQAAPVDDLPQSDRVRLARTEEQ